MRQGRTTGEADRAQVARTDDGVRPDAHGWLPIESAPRGSEDQFHRVRILLWCDRVLGPIRSGYWYSEEKRIGDDTAYRIEGWWLDGFDHPFNQPPFMPTHWQPLPDAPEAK